MSNIPYFTVKDLKERIKDLPDDMPVVYERIHDGYFDKGGWTTIVLRTDVVPVGNCPVTGSKRYENIYSEFVYVFTGYKINDKFILTAHY